VNPRFTSLYPDNSRPAGHFGLAVLEAGKDDSDEWDL